MSGHSKWSTIKHKKAAKDAKKGKLFTKFIKEITVAARMGGGDLNSNPRLRTAVLTARANSMPNDNIDRAIKKGTGELEGVTYEEIQYEGYGPGGAAILAQVLTDNKNRTVSDIRRLFAKHGGNLGETGCVSWMFDKKGVITVEKSQIDEERLMGIVLDAGAEDVKEEDDLFEVVTQRRTLRR
jgi:YebC/PmpR family DNA-binding regulatory protein